MWRRARRAATVPDLPALPAGQPRPEEISERERAREPAVAREAPPMRCDRMTFMIGPIDRRDRIVTVPSRFRIRGAATAGAGASESDDVSPVAVVTQTRIRRHHRPEARAARTMLYITPRASNQNKPPYEILVLRRVRIQNLN